MGEQDLETLCRDRELRTGEIFGENAFYGMDGIVKRYAGLPADYSLKAIVPHGITLDSDFVSKAERTAPLPAVLCYPPFRAGAYRRKTGKWVVPSASPYLYLLEMMRQEESERDAGRRDSDNSRQGTLFFPAHSTHHITTDMDFEALADFLRDMDDRFQPVDVCLYWRDYNLGRDEPFARRGLRVVSAGHMFDPSFLYRFHRLCRRYRYAASNDIGSQLFYSVSSGCSFFLVGDVEEVNRRGRPEYLPANLLSQDEDIIEAIRRLFSRPVPETTKDQAEFVESVMGREYLLDPRSLREILQKAESMDRWGVWRGGPLPSFPRLNRLMGRFYPGNVYRSVKKRMAG